MAGNLVGPLRKRRGARDGVSRWQAVSWRDAAVSARLVWTSSTHADRLGNQRLSRPAAGARIRTADRRAHWAGTRMPDGLGNLQLAGPYIRHTVRRPGNRRAGYAMQLYSDTRRFR